MRPRHPIRRLREIRRETAYHEAGHAVVARSLGVTVDRLSIRPDVARRILGYVIARYSPQLLNAVHSGWLPLTPKRSVDPFRSRATGRNIEGELCAHLQINLAGAVAEKLEFGDWCRYGAKTDLRNFHATVQGYYGASEGFVPGSTMVTLRAHHWDSCHGLLARPEVWDWLERVAAAALERTVLTGDEIDALRYPNLPDPPAAALVPFPWSEGSEVEVVGSRPLPRAA